MQTDMDFARREMAFAVEQGNLKRVKQLLEFGVNVIQPLDHRTYMHRAATHGQYMIVRTLLGAGAVPTHQDLVAAVSSGSRHTANYVSDGLLEAGTSPGEFSWSTVLADRGFMEALTTEMAKWLVDNEVDLKETDTFGRTCADLAEENASPEVAAIFRAAVDG